MSSNPVSSKFEKTLKEAKELFTTYGFRGTTIDQIEAKAKVTRMSIYRWRDRDSTGQPESSPEEKEDAKLWLFRKVVKGSVLRFEDLQRTFTELSTLEEVAEFGVSRANNLPAHRLKIDEVFELDAPVDEFDTSPQQGDVETKGKRAGTYRNAIAKIEELQANYVIRNDIDANVVLLFLFSICSYPFIFKYDVHFMFEEEYGDPKEDIAFQNLLKESLVKLLSPDVREKNDANERRKRMIKAQIASLHKELEQL